MNPQLMSEAIRELYTDRDEQVVSDFYDRTTSPARLKQFEDLVARLEGYVGSPGRLLDFGCGAGFFVEMAQKAGWDAYGVDLGPWAAVAASRRAVFNIRSGELQSVGFQPSWFDVITCMDVVEHLASPVSTMQIIRRYLRPGGVLLVQVPNYASLTIRLACDDFRLNEPPQHVNYFTPRTLHRLLELTGFECLRLVSAGGLKLENLFGRRYQSDITEAASKTSTAAELASKAVFTGHRPIWKRALDPILKTAIYGWAKVGMGLEAIARIRPDHFEVPTGSLESKELARDS